MRVLSWLIRAFLFFTLFAFASNNLQTVEVHWFFGFEWRTRLVFVVLAAFAAGCAVGVLAMMPAWWKRRQPAGSEAGSAPSGAAAARPPPATEPPPVMPDSRLREGL